MTDKTILLQYIRRELGKIEARDHNYYNNARWKKLKAIESKTYSEIIQASDREM